MEMIERVVPGMRERGFGRIVSVSSSAAREPIPALMLSNSHRPGLLGAFKMLARKLAGDGITLNTILPGRIATDRIAHLHGSIEEAEEVAREEVPAGRLGTAEEIARRRGVPVLGARELHHRSGAARGRRAHEEHLTRCRRAHLHAQPGRSGCGVRGRALRVDLARRHRARRALVRAARAPLPAGPRSTCRWTASGGACSRSSSTSRGRPRTGRTGSRPSTGRGEPRQLRRGRADREPGPRGAAAGAGGSVERGEAQAATPAEDRLPGPAPADARSSRPSSPPRWPRSSGCGGELEKTRAMHSEAAEELRERAPRTSTRRSAPSKAELEQARAAIALAEDAAAEEADRLRDERHAAAAERDAALAARDAAAHEADEARSARDEALQKLSAAEGERDALAEARDRARLERNAWMSRARRAATGRPSAEARAVPKPLAGREPAPTDEAPDPADPAEIRRAAGRARHGPAPAVRAAHDPDRRATWADCANTPGLAHGGQRVDVVAAGLGPAAGRRAGPGRRRLDSVPAVELRARDRSSTTRLRPASSTSSSRVRARRARPRPRSQSARAPGPERLRSAAERRDAIFVQQGSARRLRALMAADVTARPKDLVPRILRRGSIIASA